MDSKNEEIKKKSHPIPPKIWMASAGVIIVVIILIVLLLTITNKKEEKMQNHTKKSSWGFSKSPNPHGEISYPHPVISYKVLIINM